LLHASNQPETFSAVAAYYPAVTRLPSIADVAMRVTVPTLILAGEKDKFNNCCLIESIREFDAAAKAAGRPVSLSHIRKLNMRSTLSCQCSEPTMRQTLGQEYKRSCSSTAQSEA